MHSFTTNAKPIFVSVTISVVNFSQCRLLGMLIQICMVDIFWIPDREDPFSYLFFFFLTFCAICSRTLFLNSFLYQLTLIKTLEFVMKAEIMPWNSKTISNIASATVLLHNIDTNQMLKNMFCVRNTTVLNANKNVFV